MPVIPKLYLIVGLAVLSVVLLLAVAASYNIAYNKGHNAGKAECAAAVNAATAEALKKSQREILNATKKLQSVEDEINAAPKDHDGPLSRVLRDQLARMLGAKPKDSPRRLTNPAP